MKKILTTGVISSFLVAGLLLTSGMVQAQEDDIDSSTSVIESLQEQINELQKQVEELRERLRSQSADSEPVSMMEEDDPEGDEMQIGDRGERVRLLQELLAQDASIYPEGLATGYYGNLTSQAVARLQQRIGIPDDGEFSDETMRRIQYLIKNGAGNSGITPPGLLKAPGIQRLLAGDDAEDENADDSDDSDKKVSDNKRRGPDIDRLPISETLKERLRAIFDRYRSDDDGELEIEAEVEDGVTEVEVEYPDGTEVEFRFNTTDRSEVITRLVKETKLSRAEIEAVIEFEDEDEFDDDSDDEE